jgi:hypothetical protein
MGDILQSSFAMLSFFPILEIFPSPSSWASPSSVSLRTNKKLKKSLENPCQETHQEIHLLATALDKEFLFWGTSHGFLLAKKHKDFLPLARSFYCWTHFGLLSLLFLSVFGLVPFVSALLNIGTKMLGNCSPNFLWFVDNTLRNVSLSCFASLSYSNVSLDLLM